MGRQDKPVIFYDGHCILCSRMILFIAKHDHKKLFRFAYLQSTAGERVKQMVSVKGDNYDSVILYERGKIYTRSDAVLRVMQLLGGVWKLSAVGYILPRGIRNALYDWVGRNRYKWFGKSNTCMLLSLEFKSRMLEDDIPETL